MATDVSLNNEKKVRLQFIDMARSIAILLMLEGHFVDDSLMDMYRDLENPIYATWRYIRGFTAPTFLTVTGIVFVYLLRGNDEKAFFQNFRVKKGFKRAFELLFWGYLLQFNSFHILQCIGIGILLLLSLYGLFKWIRVLPLWSYFILAGLAFFTTEMYLKTLPEGYYLPQGAPGFIQNMFRGDHSMFPIIPWLGYTMFGGALGTIFYTHKTQLKHWYAPMIMGSIGILLYFFGKEILIQIDHLLGNTTYHLYYMDYLFGRVGMVFMFLSFLMTLEIIIGEIKPNLFLQLGQNTLTIFILHMIVLYGSITRMGLTKLFHNKLNPWEVTLGAIGFIAIFVWLIYHLAWIKEKLSFILMPIQQFTDRMFGTTLKKN
jgi:uncharacterized membrane protein